MIESTLQKQLRLLASQRGQRLYRNNTGVAYDERGVPVRFGLANDSAALNKDFKSSDLIGITPILITPEYIGRVLGVFTSIEVKKPGWSYHGTPAEKAQKAWIDLVVSLGGIGKFVSRLEDF